MTSNRSYLPEQVKREVRRRCKFGCVICGIPIFHYDHIENYADVKQHDIGNIILLCPNHHQNKTSGRISKEFLLKKLKNPHNLTRTITSRTKIGVIEPDKFSMCIGSNIFIFDAKDAQTYPILNIEGMTYISFTRDGSELLPSVFIPDENGNFILKIIEGEMELLTDIWDYTLVGNSVKIQSKDKSILVKINYTPSMLKISALDIIGTFGTNVKIREDKLSIQKNDGTRCNFEIRQSVFFDTCLGITDDFIFVPEVNKYGYIKSKEIDCYIENLFNNGRYVSESRKFSFYNALLKRTSHSVGYSSHKMIDMKIAINKAILQTCEGQFALWPRFNIGQALRKLGESTKSVDLVENAIPYFDYIINNSNRDYSPLKMAQARGNFAQAHLALINLGDPNGRADLQKAISVIDESIEFYNSMGNDRFFKKWEGTIESLTRIKVELNAQNPPK